MKKNFSLITAVLFAVCMSCNSGTENKTAEAPAAPATSSAAQKNLEATHLINKAFETGDFSTVRNAIAAMV